MRGPLAVRCPVLGCTIPRLRALDVFACSNGFVCSCLPQEHSYSTARFVPPAFWAARNTESKALLCLWQHGTAAPRRGQLWAQPRLPPSQPYVCVTSCCFACCSCLLIPDVPANSWVLQHWQNFWYNSDENAARAACLASQGSRPGTKPSPACARLLML